ncbi:MAG: hypothetical protein V3S69_05445 [Dehalococcoidales bacterium]
MDTKLILSILEAIYLVYTFHFMRTTLDFNVLASPQHYLMRHEIGSAKTLRICPFGRIAIIPLIMLLLVRNFMDIPHQYIVNAVTIAMVLSLVNLNAFVYLIPVAVIEIWYYN